MSLAATLQGIVSPLIDAGLQQVGDLLQPKVPGGPRSLWEIGQKVAAGVGEFLDLDLRRLTGSASLEPPATGSGLIIGDVRVWLPMQHGGSEGIEKELELAQHPIEDRTRITDHAWRGPYVFPISGAFVDDPRFSQKHRQALNRLHEYQEKAEIVPLYIDFKGVVGDCIVRSVKAERSTFQNTYYVNIVVEKLRFVSEPSAGATQPDPSTGTMVEPMSNDLGLRDPKVWGLPTAPGAQLSDQGAQQGDGGIGGFFGKMLDLVKGISETPLGQMALNALKDTVGKTPLGQVGLAAYDLLTGSQTSTLTKAAKVGLDLLQGKANLADVANVALDIIPGASSLKDAVMGPVSKALGFVEQLPGGKALLQAGSDILAGKDAQKTALAYAGNFVQQIGQQYPALSGISQVVGGWLGAP
jgi:hypothetical protein